MPELTLKFNLPEETSESEITLGANGMHSAIWNFDQELRTKIKHGNYSDKEYELLESLRDLLHYELDNHNVSKLFL